MPSILKLTYKRYVLSSIILLQFNILSLLTILKKANLFCPEKLIIDPNMSDAELEYHHWRITFMDFLSMYSDQRSNKLHYFTKYVSAQVYEYFANASSYEENTGQDLN